MTPGLKIDVSGEKHPWTHLQWYNRPDHFQFAIVADRSGGIRSGVFERAVKKLNLLKPEFVMSVGDLIAGGIKEETQIDRQWNEFDILVKQLDMPFFYVPGNHDISNRVMEKQWQQRHGPLYYHFLYHDVLFLCLDSEDPPLDNDTGNLGLEQIAYFQKVLAQHPRVRWTLVFLHKPMWFGDHDKNQTWPKMEKLLEGRPYTVFAGHNHIYNVSVRHGQRYFVLATTGGCGFGPNHQPLGRDQGQFDHILWVTMTDEGPVVANVLLEGILDDSRCLPLVHQAP